MCCQGSRNGRTLAAGDLAWALSDVTSSRMQLRLQEDLLSRKKQILPLVSEKLG